MTISRQFAVNAIDDKIRNPNILRNTYIDGLLDARAIINSLPAEYEWHSVEDLPDSDRKVLITFANFSQPMIGRFEGDDDIGYAAFLGDTDETFIQYELIVDGWWELPKKPEGL